MNRFEGKVVVITGGASGIGRAASLKFAHQGAAVAIWDVNKAQGKELELLLIKDGFTAHFFDVNTASYEAVQKAAKATAQQFGTIHILINNAGITRDASLQKMTLENWQQVIDVNLTGVFNCTKAVVPYMIENKGGSIINTSSVVGLYGNYGQTNYAAAKSGVIGMTKTWAREFGRHNITVNAVAPGFIATGMVATIPAKVMDAMKEKVPLKRLGTPDDVANTYVFLASAEGAFISGAVISVDGGLTI